MLIATDLPARLRADTAELHSSVEEAVGLPDAIRSRADYAALLDRLLGFHLGVEAALADERWASSWPGIGIRIGEHERSALLVSDLDALGADRPKDAPAPIALGSFGEALGLLYVVEGSSLGGRFLAPAIRRTVGDVPVRFYAGEGRGHPRPWRAVQSALRTFDAGHGDAARVLAGATAAFQAFELQLASTLWSSPGGEQRREASDPGAAR